MQCFLCLKHIFFLDNFKNLSSINSRLVCLSEIMIRILFKTINILNLKSYFQYTFFVKALELMVFNFIG